jgi:hypothetical protein
VTVTYTDSVNVGTATANATYPGDSNHESSSDSEDVRDHQGDLDHDAHLPGKPAVHRFGDRAVYGHVFDSDGLNGGVTVTYTDNVNVGTATANATYPGDSNHESSSDSETFEITKATSTTTLICPASQQYTGSAIEPCTATYSTSDGLNGGVTVTYTDNVNVGTATANATYPGDSNHESSSDSETFEITKATSTTTLICPASQQYTVRRSSRARRRIRPPMVSMAA